MIFANVFLGILVFLTIGFWVSRNEPVKDVPHYDDAFADSPSTIGSSAWHMEQTLSMDDDKSCLDD